MNGERIKNAERVAFASSIQLLPSEASMELIQFIVNAQDVASAFLNQSAWLKLIDWKCVEQVLSAAATTATTKEHSIIHRSLEGVRCLNRMMKE